MPNKKELYGEHLRYLKAIVDFEESRQTTIENKLSHIIGQSSIVLSLVSLFVPFFMINLIHHN